MDLGVLLDPERTATKDRIEVEAELGRAAGREVDLVFLAGAPPLLRFEISRDGVLLFEREDGLWTGFKARAMLDPMPTGALPTKQAPLSKRWRTEERSITIRRQSCAAPSVCAT